MHGSNDEVLSMTSELAQAPGPLVTVSAFQPGTLCIPLARLVQERSISTNTAAAGGNASLMTL
jgi:RHH-type proline utilization regulon transcriptional repressor/proline dehydrogenase/delta 1-pyrroline-5-carboxylate dehydrogenase